MMGLILGIIAIIFGVILLFDKKASWKLQDRINRNSGLTNSKPTKEWHHSMNATGIVVILFGAVLICASIIDLMSL